MERFLVTGAMGFVGSHWCEYLLKKGKTVYGMDLHPTAPHLNEYENFVFVHDTIKNTPLLRTLVSQVDCVCHFAGIATPDQYTRFPRKVIDISAIAALELIEICRMSGRLFFFTSTSEIYGKNTKIPFKEDDDRVLGSTATKRWCYSTSKALVEHYLHACAFSNELEHITVRLFNVYGPRLTGRVVSNFLDNALAGKPLEIHGDGQQSRAFTYIDDMLRAFDLLLQNPECRNEVFNIGNPKETTVRELAELVRDTCNPDVAIETIEHDSYYGQSYEDIGRRVPDIAKIQAMTGWTPTTSLAEGLRRTFDYMQADAGLVPDSAPVGQAIGR